MPQKMEHYGRDFVLFDRRRPVCSEHCISCAEYTLLFTKLDGYRIYTSGVEYCISPGQLALIAPLFPYRMAFNKKRSDCEALHFRPNALGQSFVDSIQFRPIKSMLEKSRGGVVLDAMHHPNVMNQLLVIENSYAFSEVVRLFSILQQLPQLPKIYSFTDNKLFVVKHERIEGKLQLIFGYVVEHLAEHLTVDRVAKQFYMAVSTFSRFFHASAGVSFHQYLMQQRVRQAKKYLLSTSWSVARVSYEVGFSSLSNFNAQFKKMTCKTPREYRRSGLNQCHISVVKNTT